LIAPKLFGEITKQMRLIIKLNTNLLEETEQMYYENNEY